ncbi:MAG: dicarboxylate/amino acid:cation symporter [Cellulosilyticaceae bacterium]
MKKLSLTNKIVISLLLGILCGVLIQQFHLTTLLDYGIKPIGAIFLNLMKMTIIPLILTTLVTSMTSVGNMKKLGFLGKKTLLYFVSTTVISAFIAIVLSLILTPGAGVTLVTDGFTPPSQSSLMTLLMDIIPTNPFKALTEGNTLQVIVFAAFLGYGINALGEKASIVKTFFSQSADLMFKIIEAIMKIAPVAVFALIADVVATNGWDVLLSLFKLILVILIACLIQVIFVYGGSLKIFANISPLHFIKSILPAGIFAFSTASSAATLPLSAECAEKNLGVSRTIYTFVLNLGSTINMGGGAIYQAACAVFIAQIYGIELSFMQLIIVLITASLASIGAAAIPGTVIVMMTMVLSSVGLPLEAIALIAGVDRILDMMTTSVNVTGDIAACAFISTYEDKLT